MPTNPTPSPRPTYEELVEALTKLMQLPAYGTRDVLKIDVPMPFADKLADLVRRCRQGGESNNG